MDNYPLGAKDDDRAPYNEPDDEAPFCEECGEIMIFYDSYPFDRKINVTEWQCPECGIIESDEPDFEG